MKSWKQYQGLFAELCSSEDEIRLELRFGDGEEEWSLVTADEARLREFQAICASAGESLPSIHLSDHETGSRVDPMVRWFRLLRERNSPNLVSPVLIDKAGVALSEWSLDDTARRSAALCNDLERSSPIQDGPGRFRQSLKRDPVGTFIKLAGALLLGFVLLRLIFR